MGLRQATRNVGFHREAFVTRRLDGYLVLCIGDSNWTLSRMGGVHHLGRGADASSILKGRIRGRSILGTYSGGFRSDGSSGYTGTTYSQQLFDSAPDAPDASFESSSEIRTPWDYRRLVVNGDPNANGDWPYWFTGVDGTQDQERVLELEVAKRGSISFLRQLSGSNNIEAAGVWGGYRVAGINGLTTGQASGGATDTTAANFATGTSTRYIHTPLAEIALNSDPVGNPVFLVEGLAMDDWAAGDELAVQMFHASEGPASGSMRAGGGYHMAPIAAGGWPLKAHLPTGWSGRVTRSAGQTDGGDSHSLDHQWSIAALEEVLVHVITEHMGGRCRGVIPIIQCSNDWTMGPNKAHFQLPDANPGEEYRDRVMDVCDHLRSMSDVLALCPIEPLALAWYHDDWEATIQTDGGTVASQAAGRALYEDAYETLKASAESGGYGALSLFEAAREYTDSNDQLQARGINATEGTHIHIKSGSSSALSTGWNDIYNALDASRAITRRIRHRGDFDAPRAR